MHSQHLENIYYNVFIIDGKTKFLKESWVSTPSASSKNVGPIRSPNSNGVEAKIYSDTFTAARAKFREYAGERGRRDTQEIISQHEFKKGLESTLFSSEVQIYTR